MQRLTVEISSSRECGIIVQCASGIFYTRQTGGINIIKPKIEGCYLPCNMKQIENRMSVADTLRSLFDFKSKYGGRSHEIDEETASTIDGILLKSTRGCRLTDEQPVRGEGFSWKNSVVKVDRDFLHKSHEAWIYVTIQIGDSLELKGVFTWENSD